MGPIGVPEMLFILVVALLIFGPKRLPEFGRTIGKALGEFRRATTDLKRSIDVEMMSESVSRPAPARPAVPRNAPAEPVAGDGENGEDDEDPAAESAVVEDTDDAPTA